MGMDSSYLWGSSVFMHNYIAMAELSFPELLITAKITQAQPEPGYCHAKSWQIKYASIAIRPITPPCACSLAANINLLTIVI